MTKPITMTLLKTAVTVTFTAFMLASCQKQSVNPEKEDPENIGNQAQKNKVVKLNRKEYDLFNELMKRKDAASLKTLDSLFSAKREIETHSTVASNTRTDDGYLNCL